jgi:hypothetical protein
MTHTNILSFAMMTVLATQHRSLSIVFLFFFFFLFFYIILILFFILLLYSLLLLLLLLLLFNKKIYNIKEKYKENKNNIKE